MPHKKNKTKSSKAAAAELPQNNSFTSTLLDYTEAEETKEHRERQSETHKVFDEIWKMLIKGRNKCRALQYQFWAAVLMEKEANGQLDGLIESILIDARMGDQHISKLPPEYHEKMRRCTTITCLENKNIAGNVNKYAASLQKWHDSLLTEIKGKVGTNYIIKDAAGKDIINPDLKDEIRNIIINNRQGKAIRDLLHLSSTAQQEEKKEKPLKEKSKTGMDFYLDYLFAENDKEAKEALDEAVKLGYVEKVSDSEQASAVINDEYYFQLFEKYFKNENYSLLEKVMLNAAKKGSAAAQYVLGCIYDDDSESFFHELFTTDPIKSNKYYELSAKQGFALAQTNLAYNHRNKGNIDSALSLLEKAAAQDEVGALNSLGCTYFGRYGNIVTINKDKAVNYWLKAIALNDDVSRCNLAAHYFDIGRKSEGIQLLKEAAELGWLPAQHDLGIFYLKGINVDRDIGKGIDLIEKAAAQGLKVSEKCLEDNKDKFAAFKSARERMLSQPSSITKPTALASVVPNSKNQQS